MGIKISELSTLSNYNANDILLVSRKETLANTDEYVTYNYNIHDFRDCISTDVAIRLESVFKMFKDDLIDEHDRLVSELADYVEEHIESCDNLHQQLSTEWRNLSQELTSFMESAKLSIDEISATTSLSINNLKNSLCSTIKNEHTTHKNDIKTLIDQLSDYIRDNYVSLTGTQTITGKKIFTQDIYGTAMSARWA